MRALQLHKKILLLPIVGALLFVILSLSLHFASARSLTLQEEELFTQLTAEANATLASNTATATEKQNAEITLQQIADRINEIRAEETNQNAEEVQRLIREASALINKENPTEDELKRAQTLLESAKSKASELEGDQAELLKEEIEALLQQIKVLLNKTGDDDEDRQKAQELLKQVLDKLKNMKGGQQQVLDKIKNPGGGGGSTPTTGGGTQGGSSNGGNNQQAQGPEVDDDSQVNTFEGQNQGSGTAEPEPFPTECQTRANQAKQTASQKQQDFESSTQQKLNGEQTRGQAVPVDTISINERIKTIESDTAIIKEYITLLTKKEAGLSSENDHEKSDSLDAIAYCFAVEMALYQAEAAAKWIQEAYGKNPSFIDDYPRFFGDTTDKATERFLDDFKENSQCDPIDKQIQRTLARTTIRSASYTVKCSLEDSEEKPGSLGSIMEKGFKLENIGGLRAIAIQADYEIQKANAIDLTLIETEREYLISKKEEEEEGSGEITVPGRFLLQDALRRAEVPYDLLANFDENSDSALLEFMGDLFKGGPGAIYREAAGVDSGPGAIYREAAGVDSGPGVPTATDDRFRPTGGLTTPSGGPPLTDSNGGLLPGQTLRF